MVIDIALLCVVCLQGKILYTQLKEQTYVSHP